MDALKEIGKLIFSIVSFGWTEYQAVNEFFYYTSTALVLVFAVVFLLLIFLNPRIRQRKRPEDRFMFWECVLVLILLGAEIFMAFAEESFGPAARFCAAFSSSLREFSYLLAILQWMVFVDYSIYRSPDHIRRRYKYAVLPIMVLMVMEVIQDIGIFGPFDLTMATFVLMYVLQFAKLAVELGYILRAVQLVVRDRKETKAPRFLSLGVFIIPFIIGVVLRIYDAPMMALGVLLTCVVAGRRDRYLDYETGFYNRQFLVFLSRYRDRKKYDGGNGILITAEGHKEDMAGILKELRPVGSSVFYLGDDQFLLVSESLRGSAVKMAIMTFREAAEACDPPFTPVIRSASRKNGESAEAFADRLLDGGENHAAPKGGVL